jgi:predicted Zn-dependent protease
MVFARKITASFLLFAIYFGAFGTLTMAQTSSTDGQTQEKPKKEKKKKEKKAEATASASPVPAGKKPLEVNEDPDLIGKRNINKGIWAGMSPSLEKEVAAGRQIAAQVDQEAKFVDDPVITEYVNRVGQNVVLHSDAKVPFTIKVIDSDEVNAFALPGGFFYVHKGLLLAADNEAELASVMAHEIAHVAARHAMENQAKGTFLNYAMLAGIIFGGPIVSPILQNAGGILGGLAMFKFGRNAENEADRLGLQYMFAAGYDPVAMSTMFEKLASQNKKKPNTLLKLFSTHPQSIERRDSVIALAARFREKEEYVLSTSEFQRVKGRLLRQTNAKAGTVQDIDENGNQRPTLKRRSPDQGEDPDGTNKDESKDGPPQLKRKDAEPTPAATPSKP